MTHDVDIVVIGNILRETIVYNEEILGPVLGSPAAYTSVILGKLGFNVGVVSHVGPDLEPDLLKEFRTVDRSGFRDATATTENHLIYDKEGAIRVEYTKTAPYITVDTLPEQYLRAKKFFLGPMNYEIDFDILPYLRKQGKLILTDLGGFGGTTCYNHFPVGSRRGDYILSCICENSNIVKASSDDLQLIFPGWTLQQCMEHLLCGAVEFVAVTRGRYGSAYQCRGGKPQYIRAIQPKCPEGKLNAVGGGDAFAAGLLACYEGLDSVEEAVSFGNALASLILEHRGGCEEARMPTSISVARRLSNLEYYIPSDGDREVSGNGE